MAIKDAVVNLILQGKDLFTPESNKTREALDELAADAKQTNKEIAELQKTEKGILQAKGLMLHLEATSAELEKAKAKVSALNAEIEKSGKPTRDQAEALRLAKQSASAAQREYDKYTKDLARTKAALTALNVDTNKLDAEQDRVVKSTKALQSNLAKTRSQFKALSATLKESSGKLSSFKTGLSQTTNELLGFGAAYLSLDGLKNALLGIVNTGAMFEDFRSQLVGAFQDVNKGEKAFEWVTEFARTTPLQVNEVTEAFLFLKNNGMDPMDGTLKKLVQANAQFGGGQEALINVARQLSQAYSSNRISLEELNSLTENGVPAIDLMSKAMGKTTLEIRQMVSAGKLGRNEVKLLIDEMARVSDGAIERQMNNFNGLLAEAKSRLQEFVAQIAEAGVMDELKNQLRAFNQELSEMAKDGRLKKLATDIATYIRESAHMFQEFAANLSGGLDGLVSKFNFVTGVVQIGFNSITAGVKVLAGAISAAISVNIDLLAKFLDAIPGAEEWAQKVKLQADAIKAVSDAFMKEFNEDADDIAKGWSRVTGSSESVVSSYKEQANAAKESAAKQKQAIEDVTSATVLQQTESEKRAEEEKRRLEDLGKAYDDLGLNYKSLSGTISTEGEAIINAFRLIATDTEQTSENIKKVLNAAIDKAKTQADLDEMAVIWKEYGKQHKLTADEIKLGLTSIQAASTELNDAYAQLGIKSSASMQDLANKNKAAFLIIQQDVNATKADIESAYRVWVKSAADAAEATRLPIDPMAESAGYANDLKDVYDQLTQAQDSTSSSSRNLARDLSATADAAEDAATRTENATRRMIDANSRQRQSEADNNAGGSTNLGGIDTSNLGGKSISELEKLVRTLRASIAKTSYSSTGDNRETVNALLAQMKAQLDALNEEIKRRKEEERGNNASRSETVNVNLSLGNQRVTINTTPQGRDDFLNLLKNAGFTTR